MRPIGFIRRRARPISPYHFALLLPDRRELARLIARLFALRWLNFPTDHGRTKTTCLEGAEGITIEAYGESPKDGIFAVDSTGISKPAVVTADKAMGANHRTFRNSFSTLPEGTRPPSFAYLPRRARSIST
ncbi:MAG: hypothetical protein ACK4VW_07095 [Anaerolineales bacterium]